MLRRLELASPWRSLYSDFWPEEFPLGRRTVVYGHNGSGKSTLAELLLGLAEGTCPISVVWEDEEGQRTTVSAGGAIPAPFMAVFTRKWVKANLSDFLDGDSASAIVTLGREAIDAKEEEAQLEKEIGRLRDEADKAKNLQEVAEGKVGELARDLQDRIVTELKAFDYNHFTKSRYAIPRVQDDLRAYSGDVPDSDAHAEALKRLGEVAQAPVAEVPSPPVGVAGRLAGLSDQLTESPTRVAIAALDGKATAQAWVEQGVDLHKELDQCLFCAGELSGERRDQLARHYDESWLQIRGKAKDLLAAVTQEKRALVDWHSALPAATSLAGGLQQAYEDAMRQVKAEVEERVLALERVERALEAKAADPSAAPSAPDWSVLTDAPSIAVLVEVVGVHNDQTRHHEEVTAQRKQTVLDHLVGSRSPRFRELEEEARGFANKSSTSKTAVTMAEQRLDEVRQAQFTTKDMADTLTRDLARVYGKDHLSVAVTADGKSYACRRSDEPGTDLSDGERTTLSLLYFLRKLEDEQVPSGDPSRRIIVIDDPSSSLDRESIFATHQWLIDTLRGFGQYIILTHDFSLLRLYITSQNNAWAKSMKEIKAGDADEARFPRVAFLEMYAAAVAGKRRSRVGKLPRLLLSNTSEYAYLFSMVMAGIADSEDHERLFLLPNAARRVIEVFASYKAPHLPNFLQQLGDLVESREGEPFRDVYDFCNRYSHGEGSESLDVLDARAVHAQIRRSMEFLRSVDSQHFERMCKAANIDPATLR